VTKRGWGPVWRTNADGVREQVHLPTEDEWLKLELKLDRWHSANPDAMPPKLREELRDLMDRQFLQYPWSREQICGVQWFAVRMELNRLNRGKLRKHGTLKNALRHAENDLRGSPAQAGYETIRKSYLKIENAAKGVISPPEITRQKIRRSEPRR
jgi:hypothetical protein